LVWTIACLSWSTKVA